MIHSHSTVSSGAEGAVSPYAYARAKAIEDGMIARIDRTRKREKNPDPCQICSRHPHSAHVPLKVAD